MAPKIKALDANGNVITQFGGTEENFFFTKPGRPGYSDTDADRYTTIVKNDGTIEIYSRAKATSLPTVPGPALKIGSYSPDGTFTKTGNTSAGELEYFNNSESKNEIKNHAIIVVRKDLSDIEVGDPPTQRYSAQEREYMAQNIVDDTNFDPDYLEALGQEADRDTLAGSVEIAELPTINIEGKGRSTYGNYYYPLNLHDFRGQDRIKFSMRVPSGTKVDTSLFKNQKVFQRKLSNENIGSVTLPIQPMISDRNTVDFSGLTLNAVDAALAGAAYSLADSADVDELFKRGGEALNGVRQTLLNADTGVQEGLKVFLAQQAAGVQGLLSRTTGAVLNPNLELLFKGPQLRPFSFSFTLSPRNRDEAIQTRNIIRFFKQGMSVKTTASNVFLKSPNVFDIKYLTYDKEGKERTHPSINLIKTCALVDCGVEYTPDGSYMTFNDDQRTMTSYKINLQFSELDPVYDEDYNNYPKEDFIGF